MGGRFEIVDYKGELALKAWTYPMSNEPVIKQDYLLTGTRAEGYQYLIGQYAFEAANGVYYVTNGFHGLTLIANNHAQIVQESIPAKMPRNGKEYTWEWRNGDWRRVYFPFCPECRKIHDPILPYCDGCGHCHNPKGKCK